MKHSPYFWLKFLTSLITDATLKGDVIRASKVTGIIQKEASRKWWRCLSTWKACGGLTVEVKVPTAEGGHNEYPVCIGGAVPRGKILRGCQSPGQLPAAWQIMYGTYIYPPDLDQATRMLFEETTATYAALSPEEIPTYNTLEDFWHIWQTARERTGSSYSGLHFGHYMASSYCPDLSLLHAVKLSICTRNRVLLAQWGKGLTVLLEKILDSIFVHKLQATCLLEADFNWWKKLIFARRMMQQAVHDGRIPQECFAKKHSHWNHAVIIKQFFCDSSRSHHHPAGLGECGFCDCYDHAAHPPIRSSTMTLTTLILCQIVLKYMF